MKYHIYEETFINPSSHALIRRFRDNAVVAFAQKDGKVIINLAHMSTRLKPNGIMDIVNRAMNDFNLPGTLYYKGEGRYILNWIKLWCWKDFTNGELTVNLYEDCGHDPAAMAMGISGPENDRETDPVPLVLTRSDWSEIYYALEMKEEWISKLKLQANKRWAVYIRTIMNKIGPDGDIATERGVQANG
jgi:hypothetical protein